MAKIQYAPPAAPGADAPRLIAERPQLPYLIPFLTFMIFMLPGGFGHFAGIDWKELWKQYHPFIYATKTVAAAIMLAVFWRYYTRIRWTHLALGVVVGLLGLVEWIGLEYASQKIGLSTHPAAADIYDPMVRLPNPTYRYLFYFIRIAGPTLVVPVMEELFWRDFLWRAFIRGSRFQEVAIATFSWVSLIGVSALFAFAHFQLASGFGYGLMMGLLLIRTKSLGSCMVAHGVTNLTLYLYVIHSGDYQFW
jgi:uncharacterized protein